MNPHPLLCVESLAPRAWCSTKPWVHSSEPGTRHGCAGHRRRLWTTLSARASQAAPPRDAQPRGWAHSGTLAQWQGSHVHVLRAAPAGALPLWRPRRNAVLRVAHNAPPSPQHRASLADAVSKNRRVRPSTMDVFEGLLLEHRQHVTPRAQIMNTDRSWGARIDEARRHHQHDAASNARLWRRRTRQPGTLPSRNGTARIQREAWGAETRHTDGNNKSRGRTSVTQILASYTRKAEKRTGETGPWRLRNLPLSAE